MRHPSTGVRQHDTHSELVGQVEPQDVAFTDQGLDAIIVPASRPAPNLDHAVSLARAARCWLLILCSRQARPAEVEQLLAERSFDRAVVIDLPDGYNHRLLDFSTSLSVAGDLPEACAAYRTDLSTKRNIGLILARMMRWDRVFFLDDDIRDISDLELKHTVSMLGEFSAVGLRVVNFPDNSVVCHAHRMTGESQDVFVSGAAVAVDCHADISFFPDIYNEDWLFFYRDVARGRLAHSGHQGTQLRYNPFSDPQRAAWQEFGDVLAEGLYALLHQQRAATDATRDYWAHFLRARRSFLEAIIARSSTARLDIREEMLLSVKSALDCSVTIQPELCERYIRLWRDDLRRWEQTVSGIPKMPSLKAALRELDLPSSAEAGRAESIQQAQDDGSADIPAGRVLLPNFPMLKDLREGSALLPPPVAATIGIGDTGPLPRALSADAGAGLAPSAGPAVDVPSRPAGQGQHREAQVK